MKFSLIIATLGRDKELALFLESLKNQTYKDFELIIVDQNEDDRVDKVVSAYNMDIKVIKSSIKGLSYNRNIGIKQISGVIIGFPDDDCEYETNTLEKAVEFFEKNPNYGFYTCNTKEKNGNNAVLETKKKDCDVGITNFLNVAISFTIFIRSDAIREFSFDEQLGVGADFGSGEESDLLLFLITNKNKGRYHAAYFIYHPGKTETLQRVYSYSLGFGALFKKALLTYRLYPMFFIFLYRIFRNIIKLCLHPGNKITRALVKGRLNGFLKYKPLTK